MRAPRQPVLAVALTALVALQTACDRGSEAPTPAAIPPGQEALEAGQAALGAGQFDVALARFDQAAIAGASSHLCLRWKVWARIARGQLADALLEAKRLTELAPNDIEARVIHARLLLVTGRYDEAWRVIEDLEKRAGDAAETSLLRVEILLALGFPTRAEALIAEGRARFPDEPEWDFHQAKVKLLRHDVAGARDLYTAAARGGARLGFVRAAWLHYVLGAPDEAERAYLDAAISAAGRAAPYSMASDFYAALGRYDDAIRDLGTLRRVEGHSSPDTTRRIASLLIRQGRHREALQLLQPYLRRRMDDALSKRELALSYLAQGKNQAARVILEVIADEGGESSATQYLLGVALLRAGEPTRAGRAFRTARGLAKGRYPARLGQAAAALLQRRWLDAEYAAREVLERTPGSLGAGIIWAAARKYANQPKAAWVLRERLAALHPDRANAIRERLTLPASAQASAGDVRGLPAELVDRLLGVQ